EPLAGAADLGNGLGVLSVQGAAFVALSDQLRDRLLGGAELVARARVHREVSFLGWGCTDRMEVRLEVRRSPAGRSGVRGGRRGAAAHGQSRSAASTGVR